MYSIVINLLVYCTYKQTPSSHITDIVILTSGKFWVFSSVLFHQQNSVPLLISLAGKCLVTKISPGPHRAQMASQLGLSRLAVCYRRSCDGRSVSEGELYPCTEWFETQRMPWLLSGLLPGKTIGPGTRLLVQLEAICARARKQLVGFSLCNKGGW